ncbi:MAG: DNA-directed RNA polymerase subunit beta' [Paludibacteraceae bacterium]|nr:DNA-directed RNA polymerase subunit beta' [Paludibacteraceae bacterium]
MAFKQDNKKNGFSRISIGLASPDEIMRISSGEVLKPETINYRTYKPERDGLFCERIFGPTKDYECHCGKYKRIRYKGIVCERCGVEVTEKKVRRERMGHIKLVVPVTHIWYLRSLPSKMAALLGVPTKKLDSVVYYEKYIVLQAGVLAGQEIDDEIVADKTLLDEDQYIELMDRLAKDFPENHLLDDTDPDKFIAKMGAEAVEELLKKIDLDALSYELRDRANSDSSMQRKAEALKRLQVVENFRASKGRNLPEWMVLHVIPVTPPELRPLVPLDGGRFATSDLNDLYRRVIIRNNRLKRLVEIKAPDVILRNEKRMLQEAVDSLFDNSKKTTAIKSDANRPLKSLSDSLKGKQGRFRQNLLGKRVDYSARSVIVVGPELKMHECGLPKDMAAELYKPFIIRKLIERGVVKTVKSAKKIIDRKEPIIFDILEHVMKGHPVLLNRAPTLHRHGILAFQPRMIEGKAIQLHPLACAGFNADFDGDQMAVHLPLSNEAILEAQLLMLGSHNILDPANGNPITVPSQDMILGLYYITKDRVGAKGEGLIFYSPEECEIALNEGKVDMHAIVKVRITDERTGETQLVETTPGRILVNYYVPNEVGYKNVTLGKKAVKEIITDVIKTCGVARTAKFLDEIKDLGYKMAFKGGLSFNLNDILIPEEKNELVAKGNQVVEEVTELYMEGLMTDNERYNKVVGAWNEVDTKVTEVLMKHMKEADQGFNSVYMMMDSGARGSRQQIKQLAGMRGLMAKPQKAGATDSRQTIENPILSNFKEGLSVLEYFISTHGARKGLADTALKTADAGYLTRRLVDVSHDVIITETDCGTLRGLTARAIKQNDNVVATLTQRILGRVSVHDIYDIDGNLIVASGEEIREAACEAIEAAGIEAVEIRSVLTCESKQGVCAKCYGRNLASRKMVQKGEAVGVIAAQAIGEPGTQLTLRTFHSGGVAGNATAQNTYAITQPGRIEIDELRTITTEAGEVIVVSRLNEMRLVDVKTDVVLTTFNIPYASKLFINPGEVYEKGTQVCEWDPYKATMIIEQAGQLQYVDVVEGVTCKTEVDDQTGKKEVSIIETKDRSKMPSAQILDADGNVIRTYNLPVKALLVHNDGDEVKVGDSLFTQTRSFGTAGDITGGLPRVTELFEARNPSNPAIVSEIDGEVSFGRIKRGNQELSVTSKLGEVKSYLIPLGKQILVQEGDYVRAGVALSDGAITPNDILAIQGPTAVQDYIVNEAQAVYRMQGVEINDKHFEIIVRQMMRKVEIQDAGDTRYLEKQIVDKRDFLEENDRIWGKKVVVDAGDSETLKPGQIVTARRLHDENSSLRRKDKKLVQVREAMCATASQILQGITRAALGTKSFMSAASFQETTKVLNEAAIQGKVDYLDGMKENVICGNLIPAGTGLREFQHVSVHNADEYAAIQAARAAAAEAQLREQEGF